jgi:hypothetical protein
MATNTKHWYNISTSEQEGAAPKGKGGGRILPPEVRRKMAMKSNEGGRGYCELCGFGFSLNYLRWCSISSFKQGWTCCDCKKSSGLQVIKR